MREGGGREGGREGGGERGREGEREKGRKGGGERGREGGRKGGREGGREGGLPGREDDLVGGHLVLRQPYHKRNVRVTRVKEEGAEVLEVGGV
jgi:hypothetical protein